MRRFRDEGQALLLGLVSALGLPPLDLVVVLPVVVPMLLRLLARAGNWRRTLWLGFVFGMGLHIAGLYWVTNAILIRADVFWWAVPLATPILSVPLALFTALPCMAVRWLPDGWRRVLGFAGLWTLSDLARGVLFTGFPWNPWGSDWEFPGLAGTVMIQPAAWISVHGLTFLTVLLAGLPVLGRRGVAAAAALLLVWIGAGSLRLAWAPHPGPDNPVVVLVQGNVPEQDKFDRGAALTNFRRYLALTGDGVRAASEAPGEPGAKRPIVFAWPESAFPGLLEEDAMARQVIMQAAPAASAGFIGSVRYGADGRPRNSLVAVLPDGRVAATYDKAHLVPFGEYQPPGLPLQIVPGGGFEPGPGRRTLHLPGLPAVGPLICYEVIFPGEVVRDSDRPSWLLNVTNDAWYGDSAGPRQHLDTARMRAVEEGLPLARAANTGISVAFDAFGRELARLGWGRAGTLTVALPGALPPTLFARYGLVIPLLLSLLAFVSAILPRRR